MRPIHGCPENSDGKILLLKYLKYFIKYPGKKYLK